MPGFDCWPMKKYTFKFITIMALLISLSIPASANEPDWSDYSSMLKTYVGSGEKHGVRLNLVDYPALAADKRWPKLLARLAAFDLHKLDTSRDEKLVFWINTYNILAIKTVLDHWPLQSIRDAGGLFSPVWNKPVAVVAGKMRTLHEIEHKILRPMGEPRIHFAIVCASVSCPDLRVEAYNVSRLNQQLDAQATAFLSRPHKGLDMEGGRIRVSKIFDWFEDDFQSHGGVLNFVQQYRPDIPSGTQLASYLDYDWSLNGVSGS